MEASENKNFKENVEKRIKKLKIKLTCRSAVNVSKVDGF